MVLKTVGEAIDETIQYIDDRRTGKITSLKTGFPKLDGRLIDGIEWQSTITLGGRPSVGKSAVSDCIIDGAFANNLVAGEPDFSLLDFNWELSSRVILLRRLSSSMMKSYKYIISAEKNTVSLEEYKKMEKTLRSKYGKLPITFCEEPLTVDQFGQVVEEFCNKNPGRKILVRIDHTLLTKMTASQGGNQVRMLLDLLMKANELKRKLPVIFLFLTQINRDFEDRQEDGSANAFPRQSDVYGGDAAAMFSESILLLNRPAKYGIKQYGKRGSPESKIVDDNDLFMHLVKNRNAEGDYIMHYKHDFKNMRIQEM